VSNEARQAHELAAAREGLAAIAALVEAGRSEFDANLDRRRALALCWISTGSALKHYATVAGIARGHDGLSPAIQFRDKLAHQALGQVNFEVVWESSDRDAPELSRVVEALRPTSDDAMGASRPAVGAHGQRAEDDQRAEEPGQRLPEVHPDRPT
jgi:hypothetical protein